MRAFLIVCLVAASVMADSQSPKDLYDAAKTANQAALTEAETKCKAGSLSDTDKAKVKADVLKFAVAALKSLKGARKALKAAGAPQSEKKPFTDIIKPLKAFRKAVKGGGDPCAPIPEPQS